MTRETLVTAMREGLPFLISMADGRQYKVKDTYDIALAPTNAFVVVEDGQAHVLPFLTMTGLTYLKSDDAAKS
jgi:hypothetical protein